LNDSGGSEDRRDRDSSPEEGFVVNRGVGRDINRAISINIWDQGAAAAKEEKA
jgi:hypothetical protein